MSGEMCMHDAISKSVEDVVKAAMALKTPKAVAFIESTARAIARCYKSGGKLILAGNGGSLCDAMHFAEELTGYFRKERKAFPAIALADPGHMSCVSNDKGFEYVFSRGVEAFGKPGDVFIALTTSGRSENLVNAVSTAIHGGLTTVAFLGKQGGHLKGQCDLEWIVTGFRYSDRVQEAHMAAIHIIIEMVEKLLIFENDTIHQLSEPYAITTNESLGA